MTHVQAEVPRQEDGSQAEAQGCPAPRLPAKGCCLPPCTCREKPGQAGASTGAWSCSLQVPLGGPVPSADKRDSPTFTPAIER